MTIDRICLYWFLLTITFLLIEIVTPHLVTLWFAIGALNSLIAASYGLDLKKQIVLFLLVSCILLFSLRPIYKKYIKTKKIRTNVDALIGNIGLVTVDICNEESIGLVKINGQIWSAKSNNGKEILAGNKVKILKIEGVKLIVEKL